MTTADLEPGAEDTCTCGYALVWTGEEWQHDAAPWRWGDDHDANPTGMVPEESNPCKYNPDSMLPEPC